MSDKAHGSGETPRERDDLSAAVRAAEQACPECGGLGVWREPLRGAGNYYRYEGCRSCLCSGLRLEFWFHPGVVALGAGRDP